MQSEIRLLINTSKKVIRDCSLKNGAIVAANSRKSYFPEQAKDYHYVWPRDASYTCVALDYLGETDLQERFFSWCSKAERFYDEGVFFEKYNTDGTLVTNNFRPERTTRWKSNFQPDQTGILLYAIWHHFKERVKDAKRHYKLIENAANGICRHWDRTHFRIVTQDLWERKFAFPDMKDNFTYSLASCARGLECAYELLGNKEWLSVSRQMKNRLDKHYLGGCFVRSYGKVPDRAIDTSVLGMIFPFEILRPNDKRAVSLMRGIEKSNVRNYGVYRFLGDEYDGWMYKGRIHRDKGAGHWPVLNFWIAACLSMMGRNERAKKYYDYVIKRTDKYIPEQLFEDGLRISVSPLCWSHSMFIIASRKLGYL